MIIKNKQKVLNYVQSQKFVSTQEIINEFTTGAKSITKRGVYKCLESLIEEGRVLKFGSPPKVYYCLPESLNKSSENTLEQNINIKVVVRYKDKVLIPNNGKNTNKSEGIFFTKTLARDAKSAEYKKDVFKTPDSVALELVESVLKGLHDGLGENSSEIKLNHSDLYFLGVDVPVEGGLGVSLFYLFDLSYTRFTI